MIENTHCNTEDFLRKGFQIVNCPETAIWEMILGQLQACIVPFLKFPTMRLLGSYHCDHAGLLVGRAVIDSNPQVALRQCPFVCLKLREAIKEFRIYVHHRVRTGPR